MPPTVPRTIRYPAIVYPESHCRVQWLDPSGDELCRSNLRLWQLQKTDQTWDIAPGDYTVVVSDLLGRSVRKDIHVSDAPESGEVIVLPSPFVAEDDR